METTPIDLRVLTEPLQTPWIYPEKSWARIVALVRLAECLHADKDHRNRVLHPGSRFYLARQLKDIRRELKEVLGSAYLSTLKELRVMIALSESV